MKPLSPRCDAQWVAESDAVHTGLRKCLMRQGPLELARYSLYIFREYPP